MKVAELEGAQLDYWVAKAEGLAIRRFNETESVVLETPEREDVLTFRPSDTWGDGGPIIERAQISIIRVSELNELPLVWHAVIGCSIAGKYPALVLKMEGPTPLIAAMRCLVASKFGEEVSD